MSDGRVLATLVGWKVALARHMNDTPLHDVTVMQGMTSEEGVAALFWERDLRTRTEGCEAHS